VTGSNQPPIGAGSRPKTTYALKIWRARARGRRLQLSATLGQTQCAPSDTGLRFRGSLLSGELSDPLHRAGPDSKCPSPIKLPLVGKAISTTRS
jgi:hypothetical protein